MYTTSLSNEQQALVLRTWSRLIPSSAEFTDRFYHRLFAAHPDVAQLFGGTDMARQGSRLAHAIDAVVNAMPRLDEMTPILAELGRRHVGYGVRHGDYDAVGAALLETLAEFLGEEWNPEVESAWLTVYTHVSGIMRQAAVAPLRAAG